MMTREPATVTAIVVSYNVGPLLRRCLESLREADQIVVVDNASADGSPELVRDEFPSVRLVALHENRGFSAGVNEGAGLATGDFLLLLNPDAEIAPGTLTAMRDALMRRPLAAAIGFRQVDERGVFQLSFGPRPSLVLELARMLVQRRLDAGDTRLAALIDRTFRRPVRVPWVTGSSLLVRREAFEAVNGFDEGFFLYFEDSDFCLRVGERAGPVYYDPRVTVLHHRGRSTSQDRGRAADAYRESRARYWRKHRGRRIAAFVEWTGRARREPRIGQPR